MIWFLLVTIVPSLLISLSVGYLMRRFAVPLGLVDEPGARKVHQTTTPLGGGLAIWAGVMIPFVVGGLALARLTSATDVNEAWSAMFGWAGAPPLPHWILEHLPGLEKQAPHLWLCLGAGTVLMVLGLLDDLRGLRWQVRMVVEFAVAGFMAWQGFQITLYLDLPWITIPLSILWIVGLINSFNWLDNMDGLSGGIATIAASMLAAVMLITPAAAYVEKQLFVAGFLLVLIGALLGFLWHNRPRAKLFMGDAGAYFVGFYLAIATLLATFGGVQFPWHAVLTPLCILAVPLYDMTTVLWIRFRERRSPFEGDKSHLSHRLVELGLSKGQAVLTIYLMTATCGLAAFLLRQVDTAGAIVILLLVGCVLTLVGILETAGRRQK